MSPVADLVLLQVDREGLDLAQQEARQRGARVGHTRQIGEETVNWNSPVGDGGCTTFRRDHRRSAPAFTVCAPRSHVSVFAICVTLVLKSVEVLAGEPSC